MLVVNGISKSYGDKPVLKNINFSLSDNEVIGLIGTNGSGKSTILKIITNEVVPDIGNIQINNEVIGYLPQYLDTQNSIAELLSEKLGNLFDDYKIKIVLEQLGLSNLDRTKKVFQLSGGQKTRLYLALLLIAEPKPTLLLLDEPTNNLDLEGLIWLEDFIKAYQGTVLLISHDRALLDETVEKIIELDKGQIKIYGGNYSFYQEQKEIEKQAHQRMYLVQQKKIKKVEKDLQRIEERCRVGEKIFSSRQPYVRKKIRKAATQMASRRERLIKFLGSKQHLKEIKERIHYPIEFRGNIHSDKFILGAKDIYKKFNEELVLKNVSLNIYGNQHIWLSGANGSGKSTLLKILAGIILPDEGNVEVGNNIQVGYFSQDSLHFDITITGMEELKKAGIPEMDCYKFAKDLHLEPEDLRKSTSELSRGQIAKVEFIKLLLEQNHILILDEPTNHLEIETREEIEEALKDYQGSILVVSHDRYFLEKIGIDRRYELINGEIKELSL